MREKVSGFQDGRLDRPQNRCYYASGKRNFALPKKAAHAPQESQEYFLWATPLRFVIERDALYYTLAVDQLQVDHASGMEIESDPIWEYKGTVLMALHQCHPRILPQMCVGTN